MPGRIFCLLSAFFCLFVSGCGYTLQTKANLPFEEIAVGRIENKTLEPKLQDKFNRALANTFAQYGFRVNQSARHVLEGEILEFRLRPMVEQQLVATQYEVIILASFRLRDKATGKTIPVSAGTPYITSFGSTGKLESVLAQKETSTIAALTNLSLSIVSTIAYSVPSQYAYLNFTVVALKDAEALVMKLKYSRDPLSGHIRERLTPATRRLIDDYDEVGRVPDATKNTLVSELNLMLQGLSLYNAKLFAHVELSDSVRAMALQPTPGGAERVRLNRLLLEEAYPGELASFTYTHFLLTPRQFKDAGSLALKLQDPRDSLSVYLRDNLSQSTRRLIDLYDKGAKPSAALELALAFDLNLLLQDPFLYEPRRFFTLALSEQARELMARKPKAADMVLLNRILLEEYYPEEIAKHKRKPIWEMTPAEIQREKEMEEKGLKDDEKGGL
jgi:hypothetical protein